MSSKTHEIIDIALKTVIAASAVVATIIFGLMSRQHDDIKLLTELIYSEQKAKSFAGISLAKLYVQQERISPEIFGTFVAYINNEPTKQNLADAANEAASFLAASDNHIKTTLAQINENMPVRIVPHALSHADSFTVSSIIRDLKRSGKELGSSVILFPLEKVNVTPNKSQIRCYNQQTCELYGPKLVQHLNNSGFQFSLMDKSADYAEATSLNPKLLEVWVGKEAN
ncbi:hypothetical protein [Pseudovibrio ascidiaceicola]|uniref:hypothetical protein n=1 Tax=Pseudovibrio ascidiaceicola TaxID=285279 RepID=UPI000D68AB2E|nr:hypothetical protein [Pseudovibrio ascidiaceicola]